MANILLFSMNPDTLVYWFSIIASWDIPNFSYGKSKIRIHVENPTISIGSSLLGIAKEELTAIHQRIKAFDYPFFETVNTSTSADIVIKIARGHTNIDGRRRSVVLVKWNPTSTADKVWEDGIKAAKAKQVMLTEVPIKSLGKRIPYTHFGLSCGGLILNAPGFLEECAYLLVLKSLVANSSAT